MSLARNLLFTFVAILLLQSTLHAQGWAAETFEGLKLRSIGPAFMSGRISDIAIDPHDDNLWYVAVGSGGVWRTKNAGVTWKPIFDDEAVYSTGCITIDPNNSKVIWLGTGENVGGRHVGFGDGIYRSADGGDSWTNMGLKKSEHISKIVVHPKDSNTLWVAVQGPLWNKGGERGLYMSTDGGETWKRTLGDDEWTGVTDIAMDPRNPDVLYAATWQRHRTVAAYMGGGPKSGLHRSSDGGQTWTQLKSGLPEGKLGKIGLAISPQKPDTLYAAIELNRRKGAVYRSTDQGSTWEKRSDTVSGGTGPHYYQELYASPHAYDLIYLADVRMQVSHDGGKTFERMQEKNKHSDNHALAFRADDPDYLLCGTDGGLYESFDAAENWRFINNLPLTQFYKIAIDDAAPFYNVYGGTQDNSTEGGPIRTDNPHGIQNSDWRVVLNWDGHQPATEPGNPNILYAERQEGHISRIDMATGEVVDIMPQAGDGDPAERFNWDAPILVSPHSPTRLYFASYRVWKSDNRGDSWTAISGDLTRNQNRVDLEIMGSTQSWDSPWDLYATSTYNTITSLAESPKAEGLVYVGTDDGLIQVTDDDGQNWRKIEVGSLPDVPQTAFVNDIRADLHDADTAYVALDNHKYGDFTPYLLKSTDRGKSWQSITANLPERLLVWRVVQDHVQPGLMFAATEFGIYFTVNAGESWTQLKGGVPTISFRDIKIHRRDNDLVAASFGRGIYVLDDIGPLRELSKEQMSKPASLFATRDAWWYFPRPQLSFNSSKGSQGAAHFVAENPPFGAVFTYYLKRGFESAEAKRKEAEKKRAGSGKPNKVPSWDALDDESSSAEPTVWLTVQDAAGKVVRRISAPTEKGFHRVAWDLRYPSTQAIALEPSEPGEFDEPPTGVMAAPGTYTVTLSSHVDGEHKELAGPIEFNVVPLRKGSLEGATPDKVAEFWQEYSAATRTYSAISLEMVRQEKRLAAVRKALAASKLSPNDVPLDQVTKEYHDLKKLFGGSPAKAQIGEKFPPTIDERMFAINRGVSRSTYGPTATHHEIMEMVGKQMATVSESLVKLQDNISKITTLIQESGGPLIEGEPLATPPAKPE